jgi:hypothetical protein
VGLRQPYLRRLRERSTFQARAPRLRSGHSLSDLSLDSLNTFEYLGEGTRRNQVFTKSLAEQSDEVEKFLIEIKQVRDEAREKIQKLGALIDLKDYQNI